MFQDKENGKIYRTRIGYAISEVSDHTRSMIKDSYRQENYMPGLTELACGALIIATPIFIPLEYWGNYEMLEHIKEEGHR